MLSLRTLAIMTVTGSFGVVGCAQTPVNHSAHPPAAASAAGMPMPMAGMDEHLKVMQDSMAMMQMMMNRMPPAPTKP